MTIVALIRTLLIIFFASLISILFALVSDLWPLAIVLFAALVITGLYLQPRFQRKWAEIKSSRLFGGGKKFEVVEYSDDSNIPRAEYPDDEEIEAYEKETGVVVEKRVKKKTSARQGSGDVDKIVKEFMEIFKIDKRRASILYSGGYTTLKDLKDATVEDIASLEGISPTMARRIRSRVDSD